MSTALAYIAAYGQEQPQAAAPAKAEYTLREAIEKGLKDAARPSRGKRPPV